MAEKEWDLSVFRMNQNDPILTSKEILNPFGDMTHFTQPVPNAFYTYAIAYYWWVLRVMSPRHAPETRMEV